MSKEYKVYGVATYTTNEVTITADSPEDALEESYNQIEDGRLCHHCSHHVQLDQNMESYVVVDIETHEHVLEDGYIFGEYEKKRIKLLEDTLRLFLPSHTYGEEGEEIPQCGEFNYDDGSEHMGEEVARVLGITLEK